MKARKRQRETEEGVREKTDRCMGPSCAYPSLPLFLHSSTLLSVHNLQPQRLREAPLGPGIKTSVWLYTSMPPWSPLRCFPAHFAPNDTAIAMGLIGCPVQIPESTRAALFWRSGLRCGVTWGQCCTGMPTQTGMLPAFASLKPP